MSVQFSILLNENVVNVKGFTEPVLLTFPSLSVALTNHLIVQPTVSFITAVKFVHWGVEVKLVRGVTLTKYPVQLSRKACHWPFGWRAMLSFQ